MNGAMMLPEYDLEIANTRKALEALPNEGLDFKPHEKSFSLLDLCTHLANLPSWIPMTMSTEELDLAGGYDRPTPASKADLLALLDQTAAAGRQALEAASADDLMVDWTLRSGEEVHFTMPRLVVIRSFVVNHIIHHRGQLTVYLRLLNLPVPGPYGPSADEQ